MRVAMEAGRAVLVYVDDGQGRRLVIGTMRDKAMDHPVVLATTRAEARHAISALRNLMEKLPREEPVLTPPPKDPPPRPVNVPEG